MSDLNNSNAFEYEDEEILGEARFTNFSSFSSISSLSSSLPPPDHPQQQQRQEPLFTPHEKKTWTSSTSNGSILNPPSTTVPILAPSLLKKATPKDTPQITLNSTTPKKQSYGSTLAKYGSGTCGVLLGCLLGLSLGCFLRYGMHWHFITIDSNSTSTLQKQVLYWVTWLAEAYVSLMQSIVAPLLFIALTINTVNVFHVDEASTAASWTVALSFLITLFAACMSLVFSQLLHLVVQTEKQDVITSAHSPLVMHRCGNGNFMSVNETTFEVSCSVTTGSKETFTGTRSTLFVLRGPLRILAKTEPSLFTSPETRSFTDQIQTILRVVFADNVMYAFATNQFLSIMVFAVVMGLAIVHTMRLFLSQEDTCAKIRSPHPIVLAIDAPKENKHNQSRIHRFEAPATPPRHHPSEVHALYLMQLLLEFLSRLHHMLILFVEMQTSEVLAEEFTAFPMIAFGLLAMLASLGSAPVPRAGVILLLALGDLMGRGQPSSSLSTSMTFLIASHWFLDRIRTVVNVTGNLMVGEMVMTMTVEVEGKGVEAKEDFVADSQQVVL